MVAAIARSADGGELLSEAADGIGEGVRIVEVGEMSCSRDQLHPCVGVRAGEVRLAGPEDDVLLAVQDQYRSLDKMHRARVEASQYLAPGCRQGVTPPPRERGGFSLCRCGVATDQPGP